MIRVLNLVCGVFLVADGVSKNSWTGWDLFFFFVGLTNLVIFAIETKRKES